MRFGENFLLALQNIRSSKGRAFLTMLGIIIGISAVMVIVGIGSGLEGYMTDMFESMGTTTLSVNITGMGTTREVDVDDMYEIVEENSELIKYISPTVSMNGTVKIGTESLSSTSVSGVGEDWFKINENEIANGRGLRWIDMKNRAQVCVVGAYVDAVYYAGNSIGQTLRVGQNVFEIVGVLESTDEDFEEGGADDCVYLPYSTAARLSGRGDVSSYTIMVSDEELVDIARETLEAELLERLRTEDAFSVSDMSEMLDTMNEMINMVITVLAVIASISLVVGGVGIMNIMLVSVSERTREIGIRKSLGAKKRYILMQFILEAGLISALGGVIGIAAGYGLSAVATVAITSMMEASITVAPSMNSIIIAFGSSAAIGVLFGFLPARRAAQLNPIDALRQK